MKLNFKNKFENIRKTIPEISVIVCSFNHQKWIERCLRSLIHQENIMQKDYEIIIIDDGSRDNTSLVLNNFKEYKHMIRIFKNKKNVGLPKSLNMAIQKSLGRYIVRVDSDDYVDRDFLFLCFKFLDYNKQYQAVAVDYYKVGNLENIIERVSSKKEEIACGVMFRKECIFDIGLYNEKFGMREGHELKKRFEQKYKVGYLEFPLYKYRIHQKNRTRNEKKTNYFDSMLDNIDS